MAISTGLQHEATAAKTKVTRHAGKAHLFLRLLWDRLQEDGNFQQAAALTYNTLFSLLPTLVLALLVVSMIGSTSNGLGRESQEWVVQKLGLDQISLNMTGTNQKMDVGQFISERVENVKELVQRPGTGLIAFATLLWGALSLMVNIERAFNRICRIARQRSWPRRIVLYWCVLTLGPLCVAISLAFSQRFDAVISTLAGPQKWILTPLGFLTSIAASWLMVFLVYRIVPETPLRWRSTAVGAFVGATLWELGKYAFGFYLHHSVGTRNWYGNLALIPLFMMWIYLTWNFLLIGLQVAYIHENFKVLADNFSLRSRFAAWADLNWVLPLGVLLYRRFEKGQSLSVHQAALELEMPADLAEQLLNALQHANLVHAIDGHDHCYTLSRPSEKITAADLLHAAKKLCLNPEELPPRSPSDPRHAPGILEWQKLETTWAQSQTLPQLAEGKLN